MPSAELTFWWGVYQQEFIGADRDYYVGACIQATIGNFAGRVMPEGERINPSDLMPFVDDPAEEQPADPEAEAARIRNTVNVFAAMWKTEQEGQ